MRSKSFFFAAFVLAAAPSFATEPLVEAQNKAQKLDELRATAQDRSKPLDERLRAAQQWEKDTEALRRWMDIDIPLFYSVPAGIGDLWRHPRYPLPDSLRREADDVYATGDVQTLLARRDVWQDKKKKFLDDELLRLAGKTSPLLVLVAEISKSTDAVARARSPELAVGRQGHFVPFLYPSAPMLSQLLRLGDDPDANVRRALWKHGTQIVTDTAPNAGDPVDAKAFQVWVDSVAKAAKQSMTAQELAEHLGVFPTRQSPYGEVQIPVAPLTAEQQEALLAAVLPAEAKLSTSQWSRLLAKVTARPVFTYQTTATHRELLRRHLESPDDAALDAVFKKWAREHFTRFDPNAPSGYDSFGAFVDHVDVDGPLANDLLSAMLVLSVAEAPTGELLKGWVRLLVRSLEALEYGDSSPTRLRTLLETFEDSARAEVLANLSARNIRPEELEYAFSKFPAPEWVAVAKRYFAGALSRNVDFPGGQLWMEALDHATNEAQFTALKAIAPEVFYSYDIQRGGKADLPLFRALVLSPELKHKLAYLRDNRWDFSSFGDPEIQKKLFEAGFAEGGEPLTATDQIITSLLGKQNSTPAIFASAVAALAAPQGRGNAIWFLQRLHLTAAQRRALQEPLIAALEAPAETLAPKWRVTAVQLLGTLGVSDGKLVARLRALKNRPENVAAASAAITAAPDASRYVARQIYYGTNYRWFSVFLRCGDAIRSAGQR